MDSLTQIVLGAAAGEVVLGKKIGNRAMVWGAIGGTIPDLDVISNLFMDDLNALAFHRGISHSIFFSIFGALFFGWLIHRLYQSSLHPWIAMFTKVIAAIAIGFIVQMFFSIMVPGNWLPLILMIPIIGFLLYRNFKRKYIGVEIDKPEANLRDWQWLFFWSLFTHPILDCFTMYGTQLFAPFTDYRVSWGTISVADPMYTLPFILCLFTASRFAKNDKRRRFWNFLGIGLSSLYLCFTVFNKQHINKVFEESLERQGIAYNRLITNATILNNLLWTGTVESDDTYYQGQYSIFDTSDIEFTAIEKQHDRLTSLEDPTIKTLRWFSDDFFNITPIAENKLQFNDLRFGTFSGKGKDPDDFIFKFQLTENSDGSYEMKDTQGGPPEGGEKEMMGLLISRIKGR